MPSEPMLVLETWHKRIVVLDDSLALHQQLKNLQRWRLAPIRNVFLVGHAQHQDLGSFERATSRVQGAHELLAHEIRHEIVDLAGEFDEPRVEIVLPGFPRQVEWVERNAMPANAGAWVEAHDAEWLGCRCIHDFPDVDIHTVAQQRHLVHECDIHGAKCVLEYLGHFGHARAAYRQDFHDRLLIEGCSKAQASRRHATDDFVSVPRRVTSVSGVDAFRRVGEEIVLADHETGGGELRQQDLLGRARVGCAFQAYQLARTKSPGNLKANAPDVRYVGIFVQRQRRRDTDHDYIAHSKS